MPGGGLDGGRHRLPPVRRHLRLARMPPQEAARQRRRSRECAARHGGQGRPRAEPVHRLAGAHALQAIRDGPGAADVRGGLCAAGDRGAPGPGAIRGADRPRPQRRPAHRPPRADRRRRQAGSPALSGRRAPHGQRRLPRARRAAAPHRLRRGRLHLVRVRPHRRPGRRRGHDRPPGRAAAGGVRPGSRGPPGQAHPRAGHPRRARDGGARDRARGTRRRGARARRRRRPAIRGRHRRARRGAHPGSGRSRPRSGPGWPASGAASP